MKESIVHTKIRKNFLGVMHKNHGSGYGTAGLPDLEGCLSGEACQFGDGQSCVIEVKVGYIGQDGRIILKSSLTEIQGYWLMEYFTRGAKALVAVYLECCKKIVFLESPWNLHIEDVLKSVPFLKKEFVEKSVWTG